MAYDAPSSMSEKIRELATISTKSIAFAPYRAELVKARVTEIHFAISLLELDSFGCLAGNP